MLPFEPPAEPMLAKLRTELPEGKEWRYEPKWDGFRALIFKDASELHISSRGGKLLGRYFPELEDMFAKKVPDGSIVDGEIVVSIEGKLEFDALSQRIHPAESRVRMLAEQTPAGFAAFDLLAKDGEDLRGEPLSTRRKQLEALFGRGVKPEKVLAGGVALWVTPQTAKAEVARGWLEDFDESGLDGLVAKRVDDIYHHGARAMVKVKRQRTADCVVGGYRPASSGRGVGSLLLGMYDESGVLHYVGHTSSFNTNERVEVLKLLQPYEGGESFGPGRSPGGLSRWAGGRDPSFVSVSPELVCEVAFDRMMSGRFRHAVRFLRWREDKPPRACTFDQL